ncbi:MAG: hypothetical protein ABIP53_01130 [Candidatus Limnocylindrales bacterium]
MIETRRSQAGRSGRVRSARLTDLAALGELSRLTHSDEGSDHRVRTLGLPVGGGHISVFSLFRLPLGAFRPSDLLYVYEDHGHIGGLARVEREGVRDEWTIVELDAIDNGEAGDIRFRLVQHLLRDAGKRGALRFHVACADAGGNIELFMQAGFARYGEEVVLYRSPEQPHTPPMTTAQASATGIRPAAPLDANELDKLYRSATPAPVARLEDYRLHDWERQGAHWRVPRSSLTPILRFADVEGFVQEGTPGSRGSPGAARGNGTQQLLGFCQIGVAKEEQPHYIRVIARPEHDPSDLIAYGLGVIGDRRRLGWTDRAVRSQPTERGIVSVVRTYESPHERRFEEHGFATLSSVSLLMKETAVRVFEPALVPAATL